MQSLKKMVGLSSWATDTWEVQPVGTAVGPMGGARPRPGRCVGKDRFSGGVSPSERDDGISSSGRGGVSSRRLRSPWRALSCRGDGLMPAVNFFLLARGGVAAGFVVKTARNHATDPEQEEGDGKHFAARC